MKKAHLDEILNHLINRDEELAADIYYSYAGYNLFKTVCMEVLYNALPESVADAHTKKAMIEDLVEFDQDVIKDPEMFAIEALQHYGKACTKISTESIREDLHKDYMLKHRLSSKNHVEYYADVSGKVSNMPYIYAIEAAVEAVVEGAMHGTDGATYLRSTSCGTYLSQSVADNMCKVFSIEKKLLDMTDLDILIPSYETFSCRDKMVETIVTNVPKFDMKEFPKQLKESDVLIVYRNPKNSMAIKRFVDKFNRLITGSPFISAKMVGPNAATVIGYGTMVNDIDGHCKEVPMDYFLASCNGIVAVRHKKITDSRRKTITEQARRISKIDVPFSRMAFVEAALTFRADANGMTKEEARHYFEPMICTTLVTVAYKAAGLSIGGVKNFKTPWPIELLKSQDMTPVAGYFHED